MTCTKDIICRSHILQCCISCPIVCTHSDAHHTGTVDLVSLNNNRSWDRSPTRTEWYRLTRKVILAGLPLSTAVCVETGWLMLEAGLWLWDYSSSWRRVFKADQRHRCLGGCPRSAMSIPRPLGHYLGKYSVSTMFSALILALACGYDVRSQLLRASMPCYCKHCGPALTHPTVSPTLYTLSPPNATQFTSMSLKRIFVVQLMIELKYVKKNRLS